MAVILLGGRQGPTGELTEQHGNPPARWRRQPRPGHDRRWGSLSHGAARSSGPAPATPPAPAGAAASPQIALQTSLRGEMENHIKSWKTHLAADRTSCCRGPANQLRLMLHTGAYWLMWSLRRLMPARSSWRVAQFDTLRLRLLKLAARVVALKTKVLIHLPSACPDQAILRLALDRLPRLVI
jgi:hypothetical protein